MRPLIHAALAVLLCVPPVDAQLLGRWRSSSYQVCDPATGTCTTYSSRPTVTRNVTVQRPVIARPAVARSAVRTVVRRGFLGRRIRYAVPAQATSYGSSGGYSQSYGSSGGSASYSTQSFGSSGGSPSYQAPTVKPDPDALIHATPAYTPDLARLALGEPTTQLARIALGDAPAPPTLVASL